MMVLLISQKGFPQPEPTFRRWIYKEPLQQMFNSVHSRMFPAIPFINTGREKFNIRHTALMHEQNSQVSTDSNPSFAQSRTQHLNHLVYQEPIVSEPTYSILLVGNWSIQCVVWSGYLSNTPRETVELPHSAFPLRWMRLFYIRFGVTRLSSFPCHDKNWSNFSQKPNITAWNSKSVKVYLCP